MAGGAGAARAAADADMRIAVGSRAFVALSLLEAYYCKIVDNALFGLFITSE